MSIMYYADSGNITIGLNILQEIEGCHVYYKIDYFRKKKMFFKCYYLDYKKKKIKSISALCRIHIV